MKIEDQLNAPLTLPDELQTEAYFSTVGLTLTRIIAASEDRGERWLLSKPNGNIYWLACASCAPTLKELWQRWWHQFQTEQWHRGCATLFAERRARASPKERKEIDDWMDRLGHLPWAKRRECWPWTAAYAARKNGPIDLYGWPWVDAPKRDAAMPDPATWMHVAQLPMMIDAEDPVEFVLSLRYAVAQIEEKQHTMRPTAAGSLELSRPGGAKITKVDSS